MLRLLIDENVDHRILRGLKSRLPELDFVSVRQVGLLGFKDLLLLRWADQNDRIILTHDTRTMRPDATQLLQRGETIAGLIVVPKKMAIGRAIEDLELMIACHSQPEFRDRIEHLPL
jgi:uncharacterized protein DUF5615